MADNKIDYEDLKTRGFLKQRQEGFFILRTRMSRGVYKKEDLKKIAEISDKYGKGFVHASTRQGLEIPFIKLADIEKIENELKDANIEVGTSGARLRTTTICPGNNWCRVGLIDPFGLNERIEKELGLKCGVDMPHKFKMAISGCPNMCTRGQASEIGIHGQVDTTSADKHIGYTIYIGGCGGRTPKAGIKLEKVLSEDEILLLIPKIVEFYKKNAKPRQRLAFLIEERGRDVFLKEMGVK